MNRAALVLVTVVGGLFATAATARSRTSDVDEVWAMEDAYWQIIGGMCGADAPRS